MRQEWIPAHHELLDCESPGRNIDSPLIIEKNLIVSFHKEFGNPAVFDSKAGTYCEDFCLEIRFLIGFYVPLTEPYVAF